MTEPLAPGETLPPPRRTMPTGIDWELPEPASATDDGDQLEDGALVFGAVTTPGGFQPVPLVTIGGVSVATGTVGGAVPGQVVLDGLSIRWGRDKVMDQPEVGTGTLALFDATKTWATRRQLVGQLVTISWSGATPLNDGDRVIFRGRVQRVKVAPKTVRQADGTELHGSLVTMPLVSIVNDLANIKPTVAWPEETMEARRARLEALAADVIPGGLFMRDYWKTPNAEPVSAANQRTLLDHITALYDSCGADRMTYWPHDQLIRHNVRRDYATVRGLAGLWWDVAGQPGAAARAGGGAYLRSYSLVAPGGTTGTAHYADAGGLGYDESDGISQGPEQRISRVLVTNPDGSLGPTGGFPNRTTLLLIPDVDERTEGARQASVDSVVTWNSWSDQAAADVKEVASQEARAWGLAPLVWDTRLTGGGFETWQQGRFYLWGGETSSVVFLERSWLPDYGIRPIYGVRASVTSYRKGAWHLELTLDPVVTTLPQHAITWEEIDDGTPQYRLEWHDAPHPRRIHESVTYEDMLYCSSGLGVVTIPPDTGWDKTRT